MNVGKRIKAAREKQGLTLEQVGNYLGVTKTTVMRYETGEVGIKRNTAIKLANILKTTPAYIMGWEEQELPDDNISLTKHEKQLVLAYRANSNMQSAIDKLLNIPEENSIEKDITETVRDVNNMFSKKV